MSYGTSIINTIVVSLTIAVLQIAVCTLVGYGFARFDFPLKKFWFLCVMLVIVVPPQTISTSLYLHFRYFDLFGIIEAVTGSSLNLRDSVLPYYLMSAGCMGLKNGLYIFMIRQYFRNIPKELEEAAYVDGCGTLKTFVRIMLPRSSRRGFSVLRSFRQTAAGERRKSGNTVPAEGRSEGSAEDTERRRGTGRKTE